MRIAHAKLKIMHVLSKTSLFFSQMGTGALFLSMNRSTIFDVLGKPLARQRWLFVGSLSFSLLNDSNIALGFRARRLPGVFIACFVLGCSCSLIALADAPWLAMYANVQASTTFSIFLLYLFLELFRGRLDQWCDPALSAPAVALQEGCCCSETHHGGQRLSTS